MRVADVDMTRPNQQCLPDFKLITDPKRQTRSRRRLCVCQVLHKWHIIQKVCGKVITFQDKTPDGICPYIGYHADGLNHMIEEVYLDGVSITHGTPRQHIWSFIAALAENLAENIHDCHGCPCYAESNSRRIPFIGNDYFCDHSPNLNVCGCKGHQPNHYTQEGGQAGYKTIILTEPII